MNTQGQTLEEVRENLREALRLIIEANRELAARSHRAKQGNSIRLRRTNL